jgi:hypothetical protein
LVSFNTFLWRACEVTPRFTLAISILRIWKLDFGIWNQVPTSNL